MSGGFIPDFKACLSKTLTLANCTPIPGDMNLGRQQPDGSYDGAMGRMMRGEANATLIMYSLGLEGVPSVHIGPYVISNEMALVAMKPPRRNDTYQIEGWMHIFDTLTYHYMLISFFMFAMIFIVISMAWDMMSKRGKKKKRKKKKRRILRIIKRGKNMFLDIFWNIYQLMLNIYSFQTPTMASKVLVTMFVVSIFLLIQEIFLGLAGTDMVVERQDKYVDSVSRLLNDADFNRTRIVMPGSLWQQINLRNARPGSDERRIYERVSDWIKINFDASFVGYMVNLFNRKILAMTHVGSTDGKLIPALKSLACQMVGWDARRLHICSDRYSIQNMVSVLSKSSDERLLKWMYHYQTRIFQSGWIVELLRRAPTTLNINMRMTPFQVVECLYPVEDPLELPKAMDMAFIDKAVYLSLAGVCLASLVVLKEYLEFQIKRKVAKIIQ